VIGGGAEVKAGQRAWEKPTLGRISLQADQVLNIGCKTATGGANVGADSCTGASCMGPGS
jgi:hypothetical protein